MDLSGIRVLDLSRSIPGPSGTQYLADMGAEVIKVERPGEGDYIRPFEPQGENGQSIVFNAVNAGKKSISLNLKSETGVELFHQLAADADVVFEQFRPGVTDDLGIGYDDVRESNAEIIYCSLSGFGNESAHRARVGHDLNYIGMAGLLDMTRPDPDTPPSIPGYPVADMAGGLFAVFAIVCALLTRELGNSSGNYLDVSMTEAVLAFSHIVAADAFHGDDPRPGDTPLTGRYPSYDVYRTADDHYVTIAANEPKFWANFCRYVDRDHLIESHRSADPAVREAVRSELQEVFETRTRAEWEAEFGDKDVMVAPVKTPTEAVTDDDVTREMVKDTAGSQQRLGFPGMTEYGLDDEGRTVPDLGEHTEEILGELGYTHGDVEDFAEHGIV